MRTEAAPDSTRRTDDRAREDDRIIETRFSGSREAAKDAKLVLTAFAREFSGFSKTKNAAFIAIPGADLGTLKSFSNFGNVVVDDVRNLNPLSILSAKYLVIADPKAAFETLSKKSVVKAETAVAAKK